jgi:hypothetical protein
MAQGTCCCSTLVMEHFKSALVGLALAICALLLVSCFSQSSATWIDTIYLNSIIDRIILASRCLLVKAALLRLKRPLFAKWQLAFDASVEAWVVHEVIAYVVIIVPHALLLA